jgi:alkanesulfonate monooxygenase SsuD/methylene tetrahydromethanopterin reductase-like flavin-dependent oxidoreductase (luciferase family)
MDRAVNDPPPVGRLPLMLGGSGEKRTLRIVARDADAWNGEGTPEEWARRSAILDGHCAAVGRDPTAITRTAGVPPLHVRGTRAEAKRSLAAILEANHIPPDEAATIAEGDPLAGTIDEVLRVLEAWAAAGAAEVIIDWPAPFDQESLERLATARRWETHR